MTRYGEDTDDTSDAEEWKAFAQFALRQLQDEMTHLQGTGGKADKNHLLRAGAWASIFNAALDATAFLAEKSSEGKD